MDHDLVTGLPAGDALADLPDDPGGVGAADVVAVLGVVAVAEDRHRLAERRPDVVEVDPGGHHAHDDLERAGLRYLDLLDLEGVLGLALALLADHPGRHRLRQRAGLHVELRDFGHVYGHGSPSGWCYERGDRSDAPTAPVALATGHSPRSRPHAPVSQSRHIHRVAPRPRIIPTRSLPASSSNASRSAGSSPSRAASSTSARGGRDPARRPAGRRASGRPSSPARRRQARGRRGRRARAGRPAARSPTTCSPRTWRSRSMLGRSRKCSSAESAAAPLGDCAAVPSSASPVRSAIVERQRPEQVAGPVERAPRGHQEIE